MTTTHPTILVDMDGPLADFDRQFWDRCEAQGWTFDCTYDTARHRYLTDHLPGRAERAAARAMISDDPTWFATLPVVPGARDGINELAKHADVWICTKPLEANPACRDTKAAWITEHLGDDWVRRLIIAPDKSLVRGDVLLDDAPHPGWYDRATWRPVIFPTPWNGAGSKWGDLQHWTWSNGIGLLLAMAGAAR